MRRTGFKNKQREPLKQTGFKKRAPAKKKPKKKEPSLRLLKNKLWEECKRITRSRYTNHNGIIRCYTCDKVFDDERQAQTGHFIPSSVCSTEMRYDLGNLRPQCYRCNINLSGNWIEYEKRLNQEMGEGYTEQLKKRNQSTKGLSYRADWYQAYIANYREILD